MYEDNGNHNSLFHIIGLSISREVSHRIVICIPSHCVRAAALHSICTSGSTLVINCNINQWIPVENSLQSHSVSGTHKRQHLYCIIFDLILSRTIVCGWQHLLFFHLFYEQRLKVTKVTRWGRSHVIEVFQLNMSTPRRAKSRATPLTAASSKRSASQSAEINQSTSSRVRWASAFENRKAFYYPRDITFKSPSSSLVVICSGYTFHHDAPCTITTSLTHHQF